MSINKTSITTLLADSDPAPEPSLKIGLSVTTVASVVVILSIFLPGVSNDALQIIATVIVLMLPLVTSYLIRKKVWSPASVKKALTISEGLYKQQAAENTRTRQAALEERLNKAANSEVLPSQMFVEGTEKRPTNPQ